MRQLAKRSHGRAHLRALERAKKSDRNADSLGSGRLRFTNPYPIRASEGKKLSSGLEVEIELLAWSNNVMEPYLFRIAPQAASGGCVFA